MVRFLNIFTPASVIGGIAFLSFLGYSKGILNDHNELFVLLGMFVGFILMGITGICILGVVIYFFVKKRRKSALYASASLLPLALGVILMVPVVSKAMKAGEMRDINVYGVDTLRADARNFLDSWEGGNQPYYDGEDIPESIHYLSEGSIAIYPPDRINFTTRGLGSHRGGFYIIAEGGTLPSDDEYGRELVTGIYTWDY
jgi:ABC-type transport system involved in multi-copper enzyme maturation permease subunit